MLDTVVKIGKLYREAPNAHVYHEQINHVWKDVEALQKKKDKDGNSIETVFYELPVVDQGDRFLFDFDNLTEIEDEDKQKQLYYLNFKTSKKDAEKRYLLGDIAYCHYVDNKRKLNEFGNYRLFGKWIDRTSFVGADEVAKTIKVQFIHKFRDEYRSHKEQLESLLKSNSSVVIHFSFKGKRWFEMDGLVDAIDEIITTNLVVKDEKTNRLILDKYLYKTLGGVTPGFGDEYKYKNKLFTTDEIISLMYATQAYQEPKIRINNIGIIALPHSDAITSDEIINFFSKTDTSMVKSIEKEKQLAETDDMFGAMLDSSFADSVKFDIIFSSIPKSPAGVYCDLIEISNIEKSHLRAVHERIVTERQKVELAAQNELSHAKKLFRFSLRNSFLKILGNMTTDKKKLQFHLLKVLPKIYTDNYYNDPLLLPAFLEKVEYNIREGGQAFSTLKYDFYFLMNIQKNDNLMKITRTKSYALGKYLGIMARQFAVWRDDCPIKSFERSYVGNLSRRISSIDELVKFTAFLNEKLTMHDRLYPDVKDAYHFLVETIDAFEDEKYNKDNCSLGFFESYYGRVTKNESETNN